MFALLAAAAPSVPKDPALVARWVQMFAIVAGVLGAFLLLVIVMGVLRRKRAATGEPAGGTSASGAIDAWTEAGRRAQPFGGGRRASEGQER